MTQGTSNLVLYEKHKRVVVLTLNDPERLNMIGHGQGRMAGQLLQALAEADADDQVRCVVVTGAGRAFSAGGELVGDRLETPLDWLDFLQGNASEVDQIRDMRKPSIGAINGMCYGFGLVLATHLDLLVAADDARLGFIETRAGSSGVQMLPYLVGPQWARFLALSGELISAERAREIGLVLDVVPSESLIPRAIDLAERVAAMPAEATMLNRRVINSAYMMMGWPGQRELALALNTLTNLLSSRARSSDGRVLSEVLRDEGWAAFKNSRDAAFRDPWLQEPRVQGGEASSSSRNDHQEGRPSD
jgi:enoyl-CoA hydratase/carnithine racemase